jgi:hypothetical protein
MDKNSLQFNKEFCREIKNPINKDELEIENECPICLIQMEKSVVLHCGHRFHFECIAEWHGNEVKSNKKPCCPYCRENIDVELLTNNIKQKQCRCFCW